jgi:ParD-like antitoxin of type II bacterial toxin-antitoxin system
MAKSIRITDELYDLATHEAALMHRSLAQQVEHWVKLGVSVERSAGATVDDVRSAALQYRQARDEADVRSGRRTASSLHAIPASLARNAKVEFPKGAFASRRRSW